jgi:hypothetical protein
MRVMTKWALLLGLSALSLWAVGLQPPNELYPWIADNRVVVWQELLPPRRTDLFQVPVSLLPDPNVGIRAVQIPILPLTFLFSPARQLSLNLRDDLKSAPMGDGWFTTTRAGRCMSKT